MKTPIKSIALVLAVLFLLQLFPFAVFADCKTASYIVSISENVPLDEVITTIGHLIPNAEIDYIYSSVMHGFSITVDSSCLNLLESINGVNSVSQALEYKKLEVITTTVQNALTYVADPEFGEGSVIAVIDDGFDTSHELFKLDANTSVKITERDLAGIYHFTNAYKQSTFFTWDKVYVNRKIPFAFDYIDGTPDVKSASSHGTAMAAIAAGNTNRNVNLPSGTAPSAQLLLMKVYNDITGTASTPAIIAALEDAYILGADIVNLSLGSPCGFSETGYYDKALETAIEKMSEYGIGVICSAGNNSTLGDSSAYDLTALFWEPTAELPDFGTVNSPSTSENVISAAAANVYTGVYPAFRLANNDKLIAYSDSNNDSVLGAPRQYFNEQFAGKSLEYVIVPGLGKEEDYLIGEKTFDLSGKIALIERGEITFAEKVNNAEKHGAIAAIIYDNIADNISLRTKMALDGSALPAIFISNADGLLLKSNSTKKIYVDSTLSIYSNAGIAPKSTDFSSWGPTPTLKIKPELTAPGVSIRTASVNGGYSSVTGTSPAAAFISGIAAGILPKLSNYSGKEKNALLKNLLMSTAEIMTDNGVPYSVNVQGAGLIDYKSASQADVIITHNNTAKLELGNNIANTFKLSFEVENLSDKSKEFELSVLIGTLDYESLTYETICGDSDYYFEHTGRQLYEILGKSESDTVSFVKPTLALFKDSSVTLEGYETTVSEDRPYKLKLGSGEKKSLSLNVTLSEAELAEYEKIYTNGMYIEGFIKLEGEKNYSIPFLGFRGDIGKLSPFDQSLYNGASPFGGSYLYTVCQNDRFDSTAELGTNNMHGYNTLSMSFDEKLAILSPDGDGCDGSLFLSLSLVRNLTSLNAYIYDSSGKLIHKVSEQKGLSKAYAEPSLGTTNRYSIKLWDCRNDDNDKYIYSDGRYSCILVGTDALGKQFEQQYNFYIDTEKPEAVSYSVQMKDGKKILSLTVRDDNYMQAVYLTTDRGKKLLPIEDAAFADEKLLSAGSGAEHTLTYDITNAPALYIYAELYDMAFNSKIIRLNITAE